MKPVKYRIWWSPVGHPNGSKVIEAVDKSDALARARAVLDDLGAIGAYGAERIEGFEWEGRV